ncbi:MAG TPA: hypothetical protein PKJ63_11330 [Cyclobacteriaceae bacterium]|nr:hypothetical protein [Cyclobacteriaceae bacterium]
MKLKLYQIFFALLALHSCNEEAINITCADPLGSDAKALKDKQFTCFQEDINGCFWFHLDVTPPTLQSVYVEGHSIAKIKDIGEVKCLGDITEKPTDGWVYVVNAQLGHGYVVLMEDGTMGRLFIDSWARSGNQIVEVYVTRQYAF